MTDSPSSKTKLYSVQTERTTALEHILKFYGFEFSCSRDNHPPCIYRGGCQRPDCTEMCMGFRREADEPNEILWRNTLGNLVAAVERMGRRPETPVDLDVQFAMREARQMLGGLYAETKAGSSQPTSQQVGRDLPTDETRAAPDPFASKYHELLLAVESKFPDESRHATALRYIRERERSCNGPAQSERASQ